MANSPGGRCNICLTAVGESIPCRANFQCIDPGPSASEPRQLAVMATLLLCDFCIDPSQSFLSP